MNNGSEFTPRYRNYALGILFLGYVVNFVDRSILSILLEPIKQDLLLNDTQLGLLGGLAFAIFYTTLGIPIAALADRTSRVRILSIAMIVWSAMTALCGFAQNFWMLLLARIGVGVGEAGASPPSHSLISDYFPVSTRATALSIYALGIPVGSMIGNAVGGWGSEVLGWRQTFVLVGLPGIAVAAVIWLTLREPPRGMADGHTSEQANLPAPGVKDVMSTLWARVSFRHIAFAAGLHAFVGYGVGTWNAPFLLRNHDMAETQVGFWLAVVYGIGAIGTFLGGYLADRWSDQSGDRRWYLWVPGISTIMMVPVQYTAYLHGNFYMVIAALGIASILGGMYLGPSFAMTQGLVSLRMRAVASAILLFVLNIIGMGLGPFLVGVVSDLLEPIYASDALSLRYALCIAVIANVWAAGHYFVGARSLRADLETNEAQQIGAAPA